jgi:DNA-binding MarR family transcriptional regulator
MKNLKLKDQACFPVYALSRVLTAHYKAILDGVGLTYPQYLVMLVVWEHGQLSVNEIGEKLLLDSGTLTPLLKKLEGRKLINRIRSTADERVVIISLTDQGNALKEKARDVPEAFRSSLGLSAEEMITLRDSVNIILQRTQQIVR